VRLTLIPFAQLYLLHGDIGTHATSAAPNRTVEHGFARTFRFPSLRDVPFIDLAWRVKAAYDGTREAENALAWSVQRKVIDNFVKLGRDGMYACEEPIVVKPRAIGYHLRGGNHRALALYVLGEENLLASVE